MAISNLSTLIINPVLLSLYIKCFLIGYQKPCDMRLIFKVAPILVDDRIEIYFKNVNKNSHLDNKIKKYSLSFKGDYGKRIKLSKFSMFPDLEIRSASLHRLVCQALIILTNNKDILILDNLTAISIRTDLEIETEKDTIDKLKRVEKFGRLLSSDSQYNINYLLLGE